MTRKLIIEKTMAALQKLPDHKAQEVADFADFIMKKYDENTIQKGIEKIISDSEAFQFLNEEESLYNIEDVKERL